MEEQSVMITAVCFDPFQGFIKFVQDEVVHTTTSAAEGFDPFQGFIKFVHYKVTECRDNSLYGFDPFQGFIKFVQKEKVLKVVNAEIEFRSLSGIYKIRTTLEMSLHLKM